MFDIIKHIEFAIDNSSREYVYDPYKNKYVFYTNQEFKDEEKGKYLKERCVFAPSYSNKFFLTLAQEFIKKHRNAFSSCFKSATASFSLFKKYIDKLNYKKQWIDFLIPYLASDIYEFCSIHGIKEVEASKDQYKEINELLLYFKEDDKYLRFSEDNLFNFINPLIFQNNSAIMLGHYGGVKGLSFYLCDYDNSYYLTMKDGNRRHERYNASVILSNITSFYYEDEPINDQFNPLDEKGTITSISVCYGTIKNNYLSKSQAYSIKHLLILLKNAVNKILNTPRLIDKIQIERRQRINVRGNKIIIEDMSLYPYCSPNCFYYPHSYYHYEWFNNIHITCKHTMSFLIGLFPDYIYDKYDDRIVHTVLVALFVDNKTGIILAAIPGSETEGEPLENLSKCMKDFFGKANTFNTINKTIYVNDNLSENFLRKTLPTVFKIIRKEETLPTDLAYEEFVDFYGQHHKEEWPGDA